MTSSFFLFAGEQSGDLIGGGLVRALKEANSTLHLWGVGGPSMREEGLETVLEMEQFRVMGFVDVFRALPRLIRHFRALRSQILEKKPDTVVLIDYPGFNLRMAKSLRRHGYTGKIVHYVAPTVWAHGKGRVETLAENVDLLLTIFPFESDYFSETELTVRYVGDPLQERIAEHKHRPLGHKECLALFPGSRPGEIKENLAIQLLAIRESGVELPLAVSVAHDDLLPLIRERVPKETELVGSDRTYDLMRASRCAIATSGTVTRELALFGVPTVVVYRVGYLSVFLAKVVLRLSLPFYCMVNIIMNREIFPEFYNTTIEPKQVAAKLLEFAEGKDRDRCVADCKEYRAHIKTIGASRAAADAILELSTSEEPQTIP